MDNINETIKAILIRCKSSPEFFIETFCKVEHPKAGVLDFKLFDYQKKSLQAYREHRHCLYKKTRQCFVGESRVWGPQGPKRIDEIKTGDNIYSYDDNKLVLSTVNGVYDNGLADCIEVRTKSGHKAITTPDHLYLTKRGWIEAEKLTKDDILIELNDIENNVSVSESEAILLGYLLTDGYCGTKSINFTNTSYKYILDFKKHFKILFGDNLKIKKHNHSGFQAKNSKQAYRLYSYNKECLNWLKKLGIYGLTKEHKIIPSCVFSWDNKSISLLLNRMYAADGWYSSGSGNTNEAGIGQISIQILHQLKQLLTRFNVDSKLYTNNTSIPKLRVIGGISFKNFVEQIGIYGKKPRNKITKGFIFNRIKGQIKSVVKSINTRVYDLNVPPHHNYIVDGAVVHNCGISTLTGAYALWYAMFHSHSKVLIVSKRDDDAKEFLHKNVKFVFDNLPPWLKNLYWQDGLVNNEHKIEFANGARITSLSSSKETLRSNSASLVIIDEAAFMPHMDEMWSSGWSTLMQGGSSIVITTVNGVGNWYWGKWMDAISGQSEFYPIEVNWWDMDWEIKFYDSISNKDVCIAPTKGKIENKRSEDIEKYGKYWSPWLEEQYRGLQVRGETNKFRQEVLAEFVGSGNTILEGPILRWLGQQLEETMKTHPHNVVDQPIEFTNNKGEFFLLDFEKSFWIWKTPEKGHKYVMGFDIAGGESKDFTAIEVFDITTRSQVAEVNLKVLPKFAEQMAAYIGSWYNYALMAIDTNGMGEIVGQNMEMDGYPNLWRHKKKTTDKGTVGLRISNTQKQTLNKLLRDNIGMDGFEIYSPRLYRQLTTYINLGNGRSGNESGIGNRDDLVIATGLVFMAALDNLSSNAEGLMPMMTNSYSPPSMSTGSVEVPADHRFLMPLSTSGITPESDLKVNAGGELKKFVSQICGVPRNPGESEVDYKKRVKDQLMAHVPNTREKKDVYKSSRKLNLKYSQQNVNTKPKNVRGSFKSVIKKKGTN